jgi:hypothetical protein
MRELGWVEGRHYTIDNRYTDGRSERILALAADLVQRNVDLLVASGSPHATALKNATATIPILFYAVGDPVGSGIVGSLARPGGNVTGLGGLSPGCTPSNWSCSRKSSRKRRVSRTCSIQRSRFMRHRCRSRAGGAHARRHAATDRAAFARWYRRRIRDART